jgi:hypothetical protein
MSCAAGLASHLAHYFGAADFEDRGQSAPEFWPWITGFLDKILRVLVMLHNPADCNPRCRYKHPGVLSASIDL